MPIPLGVLAVAGAGAGPVGAGAYEWLETISVGTAAASVEFTNVNTNYGSTYQHLQVRFTAQTAAQRLRMRLNGDSGQNYATHLLYGEGTVVASAAGTNFNVMSLAQGNNETNIFAAGIVDLLDAFETTKNKTIRHLGGISGNTKEIALTSGVWLNTAAITTITLRVDSGNIAVNSRFSLYGLRSA